jgi:hypothetical protein
MRYWVFLDKMDFEILVRASLLNDFEISSPPRHYVKIPNEVNPNVKILNVKISTYFVGFT